MNKRNFMFIVLAVVMTIAVFPAIGGGEVHAAEPEPVSKIRAYDKAGLVFETYELKEGTVFPAGMSWDDETGELVLDGYDGGTIYQFHDFVGSIKIRVDGDSTITGNNLPALSFDKIEIRGSDAASLTLNTNCREGMIAKRALQYITVVESIVLNINVENTIEPDSVSRISACADIMLKGPARLNVNVKGHASHSGVSNGCYGVNGQLILRQDSSATIVVDGVNKYNEVVGASKVFMNGTGNLSIETKNGTGTNKAVAGNFAISYHGDYNTDGNSIDSTFKRTFSGTRYMVTMNGEGPLYTLPKQAKEGDEVEVRAGKRGEAYAFNKWEASPSQTFVPNENNSIAKFTMPASDVTVTAVWTALKIVSLVIESPPHKTEYIVGEALDTSGLAVKVYYYDGSSFLKKDGDAGLTVTGFDPNTLGPQTLTVTYNNGVKTGSTTYAVNVNAKPVLPLEYIGMDTITYGETLGSPWYSTPEGAGTPVITYEGTERNGSIYGPILTPPSNAGNYTVTVKFETSDKIYTGTANFDILPKRIEYASTFTPGPDFTYDGSPKTWTFTLMDGSTDLVPFCDVSGNVQTDAGGYDVTITAKDTSNYDGIIEHWFIIERKSITPTINITGSPYLFTGSEIVPAFEVKDGATVLPNSEYNYSVYGNYYVGTGTVEARSKYKNYEFENVSETFTIGKGLPLALADINYKQKYGVTSEQSRMIGRAGMPENAGTLTYAAGTETTTGTVTVGSWSVADGELTYVLSGGNVGDTATFPVVISSENYQDSTVNIVVTFTAKDGQNELYLDIPTTWITFDETIELATFGGSGDGAVTYTVTSGTGSAGISGDVLTPISLGTVTVTATKAGDADYEEATSVPVVIEIAKATPKGEPSFTKITEAGKTLADAALGVGTITPAGGAIAWDGYDPATIVEANAEYWWVYTPADTTNYDYLYGTLVPYPYSSGGGGGGGGGSLEPPIEEPKPEPEPTPGDEDLFDDVDDSDWYAGDVAWATKNGIMYGTGGKKFSPEETATRGMLTAMLHRLEGSPEPKGETKFKDVKKGSWYDKSVRWAEENDITSGVSEDEFGPDEELTREQLVTLIYNYAQKKGYVKAPTSKLDQYSDKDQVSPWAENAMIWAKENGIISGVSASKLDPKGKATRAQIAAIFHRFYDNVIGE